MNDQHYATPNADLNVDNNDVQHLLAPLLATKPWVRLCSIIGFIFSALTILGALGFMAGGEALAGVPYGAAIGFFYLLFGILYFMPSLYLFKYASAIANAESSQSMVDVAEALRYQKSFWKFAGIVALVLTVVMVLGIVSAIVIPLMAL